MGRESRVRKVRVQRVEEGSEKAPFQTHASAEEFLEALSVQERMDRLGLVTLHLEVPNGLGKR